MEKNLTTGSLIQEPELLTMFYKTLTIPNRPKCSKTNTAMRSIIKKRVINMKK